MSTKRYLVSAVLGVFISGGLAMPAFAQGGATSLEEILVTGRKREESLTDVPVSISVLNQDFLSEAGIFDPYDMFDATVGFEYDTGYADRNTAIPGVRGVQGNGFGVTQQKMNSFLDGFPMVGQQGSIQFDDVSAVEMYRGPQSAAFGRSTFAGAINYVSRNPTEEFESSISAGFSDLGRREMQLGLAGPISDTLGFTLDVSTDEFQGPDSWTSTDNYEMGSTSTDYASAKLVWDVTDTISVNLRQIYHRADDRPGNRYFIEYDEMVDCSNTSLLGRGSPLYYEGDVSSGCDLSIKPGSVTRNHDVPGGAGLSPGDVNYDLLNAYSVLDPYSIDQKDRTQLTIDFAVGDALIQVLAMNGTEYYEGWQDSDNTSANPRISGGPNLYDGGGTMISNVVGHMSNPFHITEKYLEVRWISSESERLRYVVGVSDYKTTVPGTGNRVTAGTLLGLDGVAIRSTATSVGEPFVANSVYGDDFNNTGVYGSLAYDLTDRTTLSFEARWQKDTILNRNTLEDDPATGEPWQLQKSTTSFQPRLAITTALNDSLTLYGQLAQGTNPGGVNINFTYEEVITTIGLANAAGDISYNADTFATYEEEILTNVEVGLKGSAFDGKLNFSAAVYALLWENQTSVFGVSWDDNPAATQVGGWNYDPATGGELYDNVSSRTVLNQGDIKNSGVEFEGSYDLSDEWSLNGNFTVLSSKYDEFCDVLSTGGNFNFASDCEDANGIAGVDMSGKESAFISDTTYAIGVAYRAPLGDSDWNISSRLDLRHQGPQWMDIHNIMNVGARDTVNTSISLRNNSINARLYVNNLFDDDMARRVSLGNNGNAGPSRPKTFLIVPTKPREIGMSLSYDF